MKRLTTWAALFAALIAAPPAGAAMCIRWESGTSARPGERVEISFRTIAPFVDREWTAYVVPDYPFRVAVTSPAGRTQPVPMQPRASDPQVWAGSFAADAEGSWEVRIANFEEAAGGDSECYRPLLISVERDAGGLPWWPWAGGTAVLATLTWWRFARRRGSARGT